MLKPRSHCPGVRPGASRQFTAGGPGRTGTNRDGNRVHSYIPGSATDQARFEAQIGHGMSRYCYGLRRCIPGVDPEALRCVPACPDTPRFCSRNGRQSPGITAAGHGSRTAKPRCFTVAYEYLWFFLEPYNRNVICKVQNSIYILI